MKQVGTRVCVQSDSSDAELVDGVSAGWTVISASTDESNGNVNIAYALDGGGYITCTEAEHWKV